jgi:hypothetical protein
MKAILIAGLLCCLLGFGLLTLLSASSRASCLCSTRPCLLALSADAFHVAFLACAVVMAVAIALGMRDLPLLAPWRRTGGPGALESEAADRGAACLNVL